MCGRRSIRATQRQGGDIQFCCNNFRILFWKLKHLTEKSGVKIPFLMEIVIPSEFPEFTQFCNLLMRFITAIPVILVEQRQSLPQIYTHLSEHFFVSTNLWKMISFLRPPYLFLDTAPIVRHCVSTKHSVVQWSRTKDPNGWSASRKGSGETNPTPKTTKSTPKTTNPTSKKINPIQPKSAFRIQICSRPLVWCVFLQNLAAQSTYNIEA